MSCSAASNNLCVIDDTGEFFSESKLASDVQR